MELTEVIDTIFIKDIMELTEVIDTQLVHKLLHMHTHTRLTALCPGLSG